MHKPRRCSFPLSALLAIAITAAGCGLLDESECKPPDELLLEGGWICDKVEQLQYTDDTITIRIRLFFYDNWSYTRSLGYQVNGTVETSYDKETGEFRIRKATCVYAPKYPTPITLPVDSEIVFNPLERPSYIMGWECDIDNYTLILLRPDGSAEVYRMPRQTW